MVSRARISDLRVQQPSIVMTDYILADATISPCGKYRYALRRRWAKAGPGVTFIMLNPSTADGTHDDPTIKAIVEWSKLHHYSSLEVCNLYAYRASDPRQLLYADDPIGGPLTDRYIRHVSTYTYAVVCAWGANKFVKARQQRVIEVMRILKDTELERQIKTPLALVINKDGSPKHPLYVSRLTDPIAFQCPT